MSLNYLFLNFFELETDVPLISSISFPNSAYVCLASANGRSSYLGIRNF